MRDALEACSSSSLAASSALRASMILRSSSRISSSRRAHTSSTNRCISATSARRASSLSRSRLPSCARTAGKSFVAPTRSRCSATTARSATSRSCVAAASRTALAVGPGSGERSGITSSAFIDETTRVPSTMAARRLPAWASAVSEGTTTSTVPVGRSSGNVTARVTSAPRACTTTREILDSQVCSKRPPVRGW